MVFADKVSGLVLCGSANINERSQRGDRDSELLAVIRDTDMIDGLVFKKKYSELGIR